MKVFEKLLDRKLRSVTYIMDGQCGFMPGKSYADASSLSEKCRTTWRRGRNCTMYLCTLKKVLTGFLEKQLSEHFVDRRSLGGLSKK